MGGAGHGRPRCRRRRRRRGPTCLPRPRRRGRRRWGRPREGGGCRDCERGELILQGLSTAPFEFARVSLHEHTCSHAVHAPRATPLTAYRPLAHTLAHSAFSVKRERARLCPPRASNRKKKKRKLSALPRPRRAVPAPAHHTSHAPWPIDVRSQSLKFTHRHGRPRPPSRCPATRRRRGRRRSPSRRPAVPALDLWRRGYGPSAHVPTSDGHSAVWCVFVCGCECVWGGGWRERGSRSGAPI